MEDRIVTFNDLTDVLKKHGIDVYDVYDSGGYRDRWYKKKGYTRDCSTAENQRRYKEYEMADDGGKQEPVYFNFWHYVYGLYKKRKRLNVIVSPRTIPDSSIMSVERRALLCSRMSEHIPQDHPNRDDFIKSINDALDVQEAVGKGAAFVMRKILEIYGGRIVIRIDLPRG